MIFEHVKLLSHRLVDTRTVINLTAIAMARGQDRPCSAAVHWPRRQAVSESQRSRRVRPPCDDTGQPNWSNRPAEAQASGL